MYQMLYKSASVRIIIILYKSYQCTEYNYLMKQIFEQKSDHTEVFQ